ncbi:MAG: cation transporter [Clostridia bacterium]|nr:cation transporter [Clostridia bacterium]
MTDILLKLFVKNYKDTKNSDVRMKYGILGSAVSIVMNVILSAFKYAVGSITASVAITADAINNLSDAASGIVTLFSFKMANRKPDKEHPFGHGRIEYVAALAVGFLVELMGYELIKSSIQKILNPDKVVFSYGAIIVLAFSILGKIWMGFFNKKLGKAINSPAMIAVASDSLSDTAATFISLLSLLLSKFTDLPLDGFMGIIVSFFILKSGFEILKESIAIILGAPPSKELVDELVEQITSYDGILGIHDLVIHSYGETRMFGTVHIEFAADSDLLEAHETADTIEKEVKEKFGIELVVHLDPLITNDVRINALKEMVGKELKSIGNELTFHDFRVVDGPTRTNLIFDVVLPHEYNLSEEDVKTKLQSRIADIDSRYALVIMFDYDYISS